MSFYAKLRTIADALSTAGSHAYRIDKKRSELIFQLLQPYRNFEQNHPNRFAHFTWDYLAAVGARYLQIDTHGRDNGMYGRRLSMQIVEICKDAHGLFVADTEGHEVGRLEQDSFHYIPLLLSKQDRAWDGFRNSSRILLPISGPVLRHPAGARLAELANGILGGPEADTIREIAEIEEELDLYVAESETLDKEAQTGALDYLGSRLESMNIVNATLARELDTHDWTFGEADRPSSASRDKLTRIVNGLAALQLDDAAAFYVAHNKYCWRYALRSSFESHPGLRAAKAA